MMSDDRHFFWTSNEKHTTGEGLAGTCALLKGHSWCFHAKERQAGTVAGPVFTRREKSRPQTKGAAVGCWLSL